METKKELKNWDGTTKWLLGISIGVLIFSFFAPYLLTKQTNNPKLDFTNTGMIGDTIGGIMNPFITLVGILITFLAFYMQIKANQLQRQIFIDGINVEKQKENEKAKREHVNRLKIVKALLTSILKYYESSGRHLKQFIDDEKENPLKPNIYGASTNSGYQNFLKLDLLETYNSLVYYFQDSEFDWEKSFIQVLEYLDFYDKMISELRKKYQGHVEKKFETLTMQGEKLNDVMNDIFADPELKNLAENKIFLELTDSETDFLKLQDVFLVPVIKSLVDIYKKSNLDEHKTIIDRISSINKKIGGEKFQAINYTENIEGYYSNYLNENNEHLKKIQDFIDLINPSFQSPFLKKP